MTRRVPRGGPQARLRPLPRRPYPPPMLPAMLPADTLPPSPVVLSHGLDAPSLRAALARLPRPLVCACGAVEGLPGAAPLGARVRPLRGGAAAVEAVCAACAPDARQLVSLGALPRPSRARRAPVRALPPHGAEGLPGAASARAAGGPMTGVTPHPRGLDAG